MTDQTQNVAESLTTDNVSTGAKSLSDNEDTENLYAVPDGVPQSASVGASVPTDTVSTNHERDQTLPLSTTDLSSGYGS